jgi:phosphatidylglycerophosphate synthase
MLDHVLRPIKDRLLIPLAGPVGIRLSPGGVTGLAVAMGLLAAALALTQRYEAALAAWLLNRLLDGLDGTVARVHARQSDVGAYLDIIGDFLVYAAVPVALVLGRPLSVTVLLALAALLGSFYVNAVSWLYLAALLEKRAAGATARGEQTSVTMPEGVIGGTETIAFYAVFLLMPEYLVPLFGSMAVLTGVSAAQRVFWAVRHL